MAALLLVGASCSSDPGPADEEEPVAAPSFSPEPLCPLSGVSPDPDVDLSRPAVAVKIENSPAAYPLAGLDRAEVVYEELVEGGQTRFMALFHCTDARKAGPVRSARIVDPAIMLPVTRILAAAGGNDIVRKELDRSKIVNIDEDLAGRAMERVSRPGVSAEHTLYGNTIALRRLGSKEFDDPPPDDVFAFGDLAGGSRSARQVTIGFSGSVTVVYEWVGRGWRRLDYGRPLPLESGEPLEVDNVIIEEHLVVNSDRLFDVVGNPSIEIKDETGSGRAFLFRDGRMIRGRWVRAKRADRVVYETKDGEEMVLRPGTTWVALLPNPKSEVNGSFSVKR